MDLKRATRVLVGQVRPSEHGMDLGLAPQIGALVEGQTELAVEAVRAAVQLERASQVPAWR